MLLIVGIKLLDIIVCVHSWMAPVNTLTIKREWTKVCEKLAVEGNLLIPSLWLGSSNDIINGSGVVIIILIIVRRMITIIECTGIMRTNPGQWHLAPPLLLRGGVSHQW
jgi:hypothetical protein